MNAKMGVQGDAAKNVTAGVFWDCGRVTCNLHHALCALRYADHSRDGAYGTQA